MNPNVACYDKPESSFHLVNHKKSIKALNSMAPHTASAYSSYTLPVALGWDASTTLLSFIQPMRQVSTSWATLNKQSDMIQRNDWLISTSPQLSCCIDVNQIWRILCGGKNKHNVGEKHPGSPYWCSQSHAHIQWLQKTQLWYAYEQPRCIPACMWTLTRGQHEHEAAAVVWAVLLWSQATGEL